MKQIIVFIVSFVSLSLAQKQYTTPVPILKQINRHNEDGSYSYGYEAADGTFKIETKYPTGEVQGKYGYVDDQGKVREIEYGASRRGFEPAGTDIQVPPPTLNNNHANANPLGPDEEDDGQYREDPSIYWKDPKYNNGIKYTPKPAAPVSYNPTPNQYYQNNVHQQPQQQQYRQPDYNSQYRDEYRQPSFQQPQHRFQNFPEPQYQQPAYQQPAYEQPRYNNYNSRSDFSGHPALRNLDINSGSYTINYGK